MISYKAFESKFICENYLYKVGMNFIRKEIHNTNVFHSVMNPFDCLTYYGDINNFEYYLVDAGGCIKEDKNSSKITCTELYIIRRLTLNELFLHGLAYMNRHPHKTWSSYVRKNKAIASGGFAIVRGKNPLACGNIGDILTFAKEKTKSEVIIQIALICVDGKTICPGMWYDINFKIRGRFINPLTLRTQ